MAEYQSSYTGDEIDEAIGLAKSALQASDISGYLTKTEAATLYQPLESGKGLSTNDFTTALLAKLNALPSWADLQADLISMFNYHILTFTTSQKVTRLLVDETYRKYGTIISYNYKGTHVTEKYIGDSFEDSDWQLDDNWTGITIYNSPVKPTVTGVYVKDTSGYYTSYNAWTSDNSLVECIAVITSKVSFGIALTDVSASAWATTSANVSGIISSWSESEILADYWGYNNTELALAALGDYGTAFNNCYAYTTPNNVTGYLPGLGELYLAYQYKSDIDAALVLVGGDALSSAYYWSSTQDPAQNAYKLSWSSGSYASSSKSTSVKVRPFISLD